MSWFSSKEEECFRCDGDGYILVTCPLCDGTGDGHTYDDYSQGYCKACESEGKVCECCPECGGSGKSRD